MENKISLIELDWDASINPIPNLPNGYIISNASHPAVFPAIGTQIYAMPTIVRFFNRYTIITYRQFSAGMALMGDFGSIMRDIYDGSTLIRSEPVFPQAGPVAANRPHTSVYSTAGVFYLLTSWDQVDTSGQEPSFSCHLRVEQITELLADRARPIGQ